MVLVVTLARTTERVFLYPYQRHYHLVTITDEHRLV